MTPPRGVRLYRTPGALRIRRFVTALVAGALVVLVAAIGAVAWTQVAGGGEAEPEADTDRQGPSASAVAASSPSASASPTPSPSPSPSSLTVIAIGWVGDTTPGSMYGLPPDRGRALFASMRDELRAPDLMIANLEGTFSEGGPSKCGQDSTNCYAFQAPLANAPALNWAGIDMVSLANNHTYDFFERGMTQTTGALEANGIEYTGLPKQITVVKIDGVRVATVGFSPYPWNANLNDIPAAQELVRRAAADADVVVVLMHAGAEGAGEAHTPQGAETAYGENRGDSRAFAHAVVDAGADLVLGSGPHVIRGIERYENRLIAYSLGNFAGWDNFGLSGNLGLSGLLTVKVDAKGRIHGGRWLSLRLAEPGVPKTDPGHTSAHMVSDLSTQDFAKTYDIDATGHFTAR
ncbi:MAG TPA: CapA family protein [Thermoleophilia bacterium]|nr:CapA family protein [Thermoleophilia bacterium]